MNDKSIQVLIQKFFLERLMAQRQVSPQTVKSYRDTFRLYLRFMTLQHRISLTKMSISHFDAEHILEFLNYLGAAVRLPHRQILYNRRREPTMVGGKKVDKK